MAQPRPWWDPSKAQQAVIDSVRNPPPEPPPHRCGRCNNGTGVYNPNCPGRRPT
jgi:hypothetical protein